MSVRAITWAWEQGVGSSKKLVLVALADHADPEGYAFPGLPRVAGMCSMQARNVRAHMAALEEEGYLERIRRFRQDGSQTSNGYRLKIPDEYGRQNPATPPAESCNPPGRELPPPRIETAALEPSVEPKSKTPPESPPQGGDTPRPRSRKRTEPFVPPTLEEVMAYARAERLGTPGLVKRWWLGKEGNGWKNGKNPTRDWRATYRHFLECVAKDEGITGRGFGPGPATADPHAKLWLEVERKVNQMRLGVDPGEWSDERIPEVLDRLGARVLDRGVPLGELREPFLEQWSQ